MGVAVGAYSSTNFMSLSALRDHVQVTRFKRGESLTVHLELPGEALFAMRLNDGGGQLASVPGSRPVTNKCQTQVFAADPSSEQVSADVSITTPCDNAPATITVAVVAATRPTGPMHFANISIKREEGQDPRCPRNPSSPTPPYPFNLPINETCPNGAAAQHRSPCPKVACVSPPGKEGTCVTSSDGSVPDSNGSIDAEARVDLLTDDVTPISHHFITGGTNKDLTPRAWSRNMTGWTLRIDGEVENARDFTMADLKRFPHVTRQYVIECSGNWGRGMVPSAAQADFWNIGAVGCAKWTGVLLRDVLQVVGVTSKGAFVAYFGEDNFRSRGIPLLKALDGHTMLAWAMNGEALPAFHGFPLRLIAPGYPGSAQGKWLKRLWVRDRVHDGLGMMGKSYKLPKFPLKPGSYDAPDSDFKIFTQQPVRSLIVRPPRCTVTSNLTIWLEGKAWSGAGDVSRVELSYDFGASWHPTQLSRPVNKWAWQRWEAKLTVPTPGVWFIYARATDHLEAAQPMLVPGWNPGGYANNQAMMVDIEVTPPAHKMTPILRAPEPQTQRLDEVCAVCGHEYDPLKDCGGSESPHMDCGKGVAFDDLPETWRCPVCGVLKKNYYLKHATPAPSPKSLPMPQEVCAVCGHEYNPLKDCGGRDNPNLDCGQGAAFDDLPESWRCPVCGVPKKNYHLEQAAPTPQPSPFPMPQHGQQQQCPVCQHVYDPMKDCGGMDNLGEDCGHGVPFESLPDDWRCPLCGTDKSHYHRTHPKQRIASVDTNAIGDVVVQSGNYVAVAVVSAATVMTLYGLATKTMLIICLVSAAVVVSGRAALSGSPSLMIGHAVGMLMCWSFMTIGTILRRSMLSSDGLPQIDQARSLHAFMQSCALCFAIVGVGCMFKYHASMRASHLGLNSGTPFANTLHAVMGWCVLALMMLQGSQGWLKYLHARLGKVSYVGHSRLGKAVLMFSSGNIVLILWSVRVQAGNTRAVFISLSVVLASTIACVISGRQAALARVQEDAGDNFYEAMLK